MSPPDLPPPSEVVEKIREKVGEFIHRDHGQPSAGDPATAEGVAPVAEKGTDTMPKFAKYAPIGAMPSAEFQGEVASLDGNTPALFVSPSNDLVAKPGSNQDSWFLTSHLETSHGVLDVLLHYLHMVPPTGGEGMLGMMLSVLDNDKGVYISEEQDFPGDKCTLETEECNVVSPIASVSGDASALAWKGTWSGIGVSVDLSVTQDGPMLANMGAGLWPTLGGMTYHYALPTMTTTGTITLDGETIQVSGNSWLDRQWGVTPRFFVQTQKRWVWFSICLDDGTRISVWELREYDRCHTWATILNTSGAHEVVAVEPLIDNSSEPWTSPDTGRIYPTHWSLKMPQIGSEITIAPKVLAQEFQSPAGAHKYEGSAPATGTLHGKPANGYAVIELVGDWV